jgi:hypothetical protein
MLTFTHFLIHSPHTLTLTHLLPHLHTLTLTLTCAQGLLGPRQEAEDHVGVGNTAWRLADSPA